jgi:tRNA G46 methylase TrmB
MTSQAFEQHVDRYDEWFERNRAVYESELRPVASLLPGAGTRIEIGVGTGRFAARLGIAVGVARNQAIDDQADGGVKYP